MSSLDTVNFQRRRVSAMAAARQRQRDAHRGHRADRPEALFALDDPRRATAALVAGGLRLLLPVLPASAISIANIPVAKLWVKEHRDPHWLRSRSIGSRRSMSRRFEWGRYRRHPRRRFS